MPVIRVYADTSVFGGTEDPEFSESSCAFFGRVHQGAFTLLLSKLTLDELEPAPAAVKQLLVDLPEGRVEHVAVGDDVVALAEAYINAGALGPGSRMDAMHVAAATVARADLILSWNFKHIVNYERIRKFNGVNALQGYPAIEFRSPLELGHESENEDI